MLSEFGAAEGVDVSAEALSFCQARGLENVKHGEAEALPYEAGSFDLVTGLDVVEHLDDDLRGLEGNARGCCVPAGGRSCLCRRSCFCGACRTISVITGAVTL